MKTTLGMAALTALLSAASGLDCTGNCLLEANTTLMDKRMAQKIAHHHSKVEERAQMRAQAVPTGPAACVNGMAGGFFPCKNVDLQSTVSLEDLGGNPRGGFDGNDIWGWTDPVTNIEYALMGRMDGVTIVELSDPQNPRPIVNINSRVTPRTSALWRDVKVYKNTAYIVADGLNGHGVQVFDLERVRGYTGGLVTASPDFLYSNFAAHNIFINEDSGYGMVVGARSTCAGGLHLIDLSNRLEPTFAGCYSADGYTHDVQCVTWDKSKYTAGDQSIADGSEICFAYNEDTLTIVDITDKRVNSQNEINAVQLARTRYSGNEYSHQGWISEDGQFVFLDDELDEEDSPTRTRTYIFDVTSLRNPQLIKISRAPSIAIDHNLYIKGNKGYMSNYASGLRINDVSNPRASGDLPEIAYFDTFPSTRTVATFDGIWSSYVYFPSGNLILGSTEYGLIVVKENYSGAPSPTPTPPTPTPPTPTPPTPTPPTPTPPTPTPTCTNNEVYTITCDQVAAAPQNYCQYASVRANCRLSCGVCQPDAPSPSPTPTPSCQDSSPSGFTLGNGPVECPEIQYYCTNGSLQQAVQEACPVTCGTCGSAQRIPLNSLELGEDGVLLQAESSSAVMIGGIAGGAAFVAIVVGAVIYRKRSSAAAAAEEPKLGVATQNPAFSL